MRFRPCIDLRNGEVVQIVGGTLVDGAAPVTNFSTSKPPAAFAEMYKADQLVGGHVIALGPGNEEAALSALRAYPQGLQFGGGINPQNAKTYLDAGASHVIVTSYVFTGGALDRDRLRELVAAVGKERLVLDLSCRKRGGAYYVVTDRWQKFTDLEVNQSTLEDLAQFCTEFLVHGVDVEGTRAGMDLDLIKILGEASPLPVTYAGGARCLADLDAVLKDVLKLFSPTVAFCLAPEHSTLEQEGSGKVSLTIGSALDIFGGDVPYADVVAWDIKHRSPKPSP